MLTTDLADLSAMDGPGTSADGKEAGVRTGDLREATAADIDVITDKGKDVPWPDLADVGSKPDMAEVGLPDVLDVDGRDEGPVDVPKQEDVLLPDPGMEINGSLPDGADLVGADQAVLPEPEDVPVEPDLPDMVESPEDTGFPDEQVLPDEEMLGDAVADLFEELPSEDTGPDCLPIEDPTTWPEPGAILAKSAFKKIGEGPADEEYKKKNGQVVPKTNQSYVWSLAREGDRVWVGTMANMICLAFTGFGQEAPTYESENAVCSSLMVDPLNPVLFPDWRAPEIWEYNIKTGKWTQRTETGTKDAPGIAQETLGWRASISVGPYYIVSGPGTGFLWGMSGYGTSIAIYKNGEYLGARKLSDCNDSRKWVEYGGRVYMGTQMWDGDGGILRWDGDESNLPDSLFKFTLVGKIKGSAAWVEGYKGRLYAITWPTAFVGGGEGFELYRSPKIPPCGLTENEAGSWEKVFAYKDYDPNPETAKLAGGGAMIVYQGALYFGSMHLPFASKCPNPDDIVACALHKYEHSEAFSLFRLVEDDSGAVSIELLYGKDKGGAYTPVMGDAGFGNPCNNYFWSVAVLDGVLYAGTMDFSVFIEDALSAYGMPSWFLEVVPCKEHGFDIWATKDGYTWTKVVDDGLGNKFNWGARQMISDGSSLWVGTANPFNISPAGGWELWMATK